MWVVYTHRRAHAQADATLISESSRALIARMALEGARPQAIWNRLCSESLKPSVDTNLNGLSQAHVYYWWRRSFESQFLRDAQDERRSADAWLREQEGVQVQFSVNGGEFCPSSIAFLTPLAADSRVAMPNITDVFVDATYKTNKAKYDLYCLLADVRGASTPLSYLLLRSAIASPPTNEPITISMAQGTHAPEVREVAYADVCVWARHSHWIETWLRDMEQRGLRPTWFHSDKDFGQVHPAQQVWPHAKISLCLWHSKKAISTWMKANGARAKGRHSVRGTQQPLKGVPAALPLSQQLGLRMVSQEAEGLMAELESSAQPSLANGSPVSSVASSLDGKADLPPGDEPFRKQDLSGLPEYLSFLSHSYYTRTTQLGSQGARTRRLPAETYTDETIYDIALMFSRHYNRHPSIPSLISAGSGEQAPTYENPDQIHATSVREMLEAANGRPRLFQYLWQNWYRVDRWRLWARSRHPQVSMFRTTMKLEAHWRALKRDFMVEFGKPRMDLLVYIIVKELMVPMQVRLHKIADGGRPPWLADFQKEWSKAQKRLEDPEKPFDPGSLRRYATDSVAWVCACPSFYLSPHWVCKHLVYQCGLPRWEYPRWNATENPLRFTSPPFVRINGQLAAAVSIQVEHAPNPPFPPQQVDSSPADDVAVFREARLVLEAIRTDLALLDSDLATQSGRQLRIIAGALNSTMGSELRRYADSARVQDGRRRHPRTWGDHDRFTLYRR